MNYKNIYKSICNQIRKNYILESIAMEPMPSDGGGGQYFYPMGPPERQTPSTSPTWGTSDPNPQPVTPKPNGHMGNPYFHQFPVSPDGLPIEIWVFNPNPSPYGSFQLFRLNEGQYTPHGSPIKLRQWVDYGPANPIERNPNIPVVLPFGIYPNGDFPNPVFGPGIEPDPGGLNWPPGFNPNFWQMGPSFVLPPGWGVTPYYPHPTTPDVPDPYGPRTPGGMPPVDRPGMFPGGLYPYRPNDPNYDPQNPFFTPTEETPEVLPPRRPNPPPRPQRDPTDIFYGFD